MVESPVPVHQADTYEFGTYEFDTGSNFSMPFLSPIISHGGVENRLESLYLLLVSSHGAEYYAMVLVLFIFQDGKKCIPHSENSTEHVRDRQTFDIIFIYVWSSE